MAAAAALLTAALPAPRAAAQVVDPVPVPFPVAGSVGLETVASGLVAPVWGTFAPGQPGRLFIVDQVGTLWVIDLASGTRSAFLTIPGLVISGERGFLGAAFHPDYASNGRLYTYTSEPAVAADFPPPLGAPANHVSVIAEWTVPEPANPAAVADPLSKRVLFRVGQTQGNHNGGALVFGPDGLLYVALGDGGSANDTGAGHVPGGNGQDPGTVLGAILRINPLGTTSANGQYGVPATNPFFPGGTAPFGGAGGCTDGFCDEVYAYGFRNPFRIAFDPAAGTLIAADVGQNEIEEIDQVTRGANLGWPIKEGSYCFDQASGQIAPPAECPTPGLKEPIAQYDHDEGNAVIGGFVYRGAALPPLAGRYLFGDFAGPTGASGRLLVLGDPFRIGGLRQFRILELAINGTPGLGQFLLGFGQDAAGEVYVLANATASTSGTTGVVLKIVPPN